MRDELWNARRNRLTECAFLGMSVSDAAVDTGLCIQTVRTYADKFGIKFSAVSRARTEKIIAIEACASEGLTRSQACEKLGMSAHSLGEIARAHNIKFVHALKDDIDHERADAMAAMYRAGKTLGEIGALYGVSRERVRQIISKYRGLSSENGGQAVRSKIERERTRARKEADCYSKHGCSLSQLKELRALGRQMAAKGFTRERTPIGAFIRQRHNAIGRGIEWRITLWEWWAIWVESGKWDERGRTADAYVMCRFSDDGAYEVGNVYVATAHHNVTVQPNNRYRKSHPEFEEAMSEKAKRKGQTETRCCEVDGCVRPHYGKGLCGTHYRVQWARAKRARLAQSPTSQHERVAQ